MAVVPRAVALPSLRVPRSTDVLPAERVLAPERVRVPVPTLVRLNPPVMPADSVMSPEPPIAAPLVAVLLERVTTPLKEAAAPELVRAPVPLTPVPMRVTASAVPRVKPLRSSAAPVPLTRVPPAVVPRGVLVAPPAAPRATVPAEIVVTPV